MRNSNCLPAIFFWEKLSKVSKSSAHTHTTLQTNENHLIDWKLKGNDRSKIACQDPVKNTREIAPWFDDFLKPRSLKNGDAVLFSNVKSNFESVTFSMADEQEEKSMVAGFFWLEFDYQSICKASLWWWSLLLLLLLLLLDASWIISDLMIKRYSI